MICYPFEVSNEYKVSNEYEVSNEYVYEAYRATLGRSFYLGLRTIRDYGPRQIFSETSR